MINAPFISWLYVNFLCTQLDIHKKVVLNFERKESWRQNRRGAVARAYRSRPMDSTVNSFVYPKARRKLLKRAFDNLRALNIHNGPTIVSRL